MNHTLENETLTIYLKGELNSFNSEEVEKEIESIIDKCSFKAIVLDLKELSYISSAGLRIVVRLKQQFDDISIINTQNNVHDIFEMVGFDNLIKIEKINS